jgi:ParB-like chromosome segregation protein Spo0J
VSGGDAQLELLPAGPAELRRDSIALELLDGFQNAKASARLRELIHELGLLQPIIAANAGSGRYRVIDGGRRARAIALLADDRQRPTPARVEALVIEGGDTRRREARGGLTLAHVRQQSRQQTTEATAELPQGLFVVHAAD